MEWYGTRFIERKQVSEGAYLEEKLEHVRNQFIETVFGTSLV